LSTHTTHHCSTACTYKRSTFIRGTAVLSLYIHRIFGTCRLTLFAPIRVQAFPRFHTAIFIKLELFQRLALHPSTMAQHEESDARTSKLRVERQQVENSEPLEAMTSLFSGEIIASHAKLFATVELQRRRRRCQSTTVLLSCANNTEQHSVRWTILTSHKESSLHVLRRRKLSRSALESSSGLSISTTALCWLLLLIALVHPGITVRAQTTTTPGKRRKLMMAMKGMKDHYSMCSQFQRV
jgi:hypothetical protein